MADTKQREIPSDFSLRFARYNCQCFNASEGSLLLIPRRSYPAEYPNAHCITSRDPRMRAIRRYFQLPAKRGKSNEIYVALRSDGCLSDRIYNRTDRAENCQNEVNWGGDQSGVQGEDFKVSYCHTFHHTFSQTRPCLLGPIPA